MLEEEQDKKPEAKLSFKEIVLKHLAKIGEISSKEFRAGYWQERPISVGGGIAMLKTYIEDTRDAYINATDYLHDLLLPLFDKEMTKQDKLVETELEETYEESKRTEGSKKTEWIDKKLKIKRKLFQQLSLLLCRLKYFQE